MKVDVFNIKWDVEDSEAILPISFQYEFEDELEEDDLIESISDKLSDDTGWCHDGFDYKIISPLPAFREDLKNLLEKYNAQIGWAVAIREEVVPADWESLFIKIGNEKELFANWILTHKVLEKNK